MTSAKIMPVNRPPDRLEPPAGWAGATTLRFPPPPPKQRGLLFRIISTCSGLLGRPQLPDLFPALHVNARLFWPWLLFASQLMPFGRLAATDRELLILRTAWLCRSRYEWGQHLQLGLAAGLRDDDILRIVAGPEDCSDPRIRTLLAACDDICVGECIQDHTWQDICRYFGAPIRVEITMLVGHYRMIAGFLNSSGLQLEPAIELCLQDFHRRLPPAP